MIGRAKIAIQQLANRCGYQIRRVEPGVSFSDPYIEQRRILGPDILTVFEVGAADGRDSVRYSELFPSASVFAFEPIPKSFAEIEKKIESHPRIKGFNCALSNQSGEADFHIGNWPDASSLLSAKSTGSVFDEYTASSTSIRVSINTIDDICEDMGVSTIDILKMDAQGAELKILAGAKGMLAKSAIRMIYTEVNFLEIYDGCALFHQVTSVLIEAGFSLHNIYDLHHNHRGKIAWGDALFIHSSVQS